MHNCSMSEIEAKMRTPDRAYDGMRWWVLYGQDEHPKPPDEKFDLQINDVQYQCTVSLIDNPNYQDGDPAEMRYTIQQHLTFVDYVRVES